MRKKRGPWEAKVVAGGAGAAAGGGAGTILAGFVLWLLGCSVWGVDWSADKATAAIAAVPGPVTGLVLLVLGGVSALVGSLEAGWRAPHTPRPDLAPPARAVPTVAPPPTRAEPLDVGLDLMHTGPVPQLP